MQPDDETVSPPGAGRHNTLPMRPFLNYKDEVEERDGERERHQADGLGRF